MASCAPCCMRDECRGEGERLQKEQRSVGGLEVITVDVPIKLPHSVTNRHRPQPLSLPGLRTNTPTHTHARVCKRVIGL